MFAVVLKLFFVVDKSEASIAAFEDSVTNTLGATVFYGSDCRVGRVNFL